ncbi:MAG: Ser-Thr-rich glycosyl-phosphatidyl-inositol-anchored membrane family protein [candidate division BRC1 bacterium ADurb.BinA364]|nr:MAG: Ser-Thr-rich glycosyl-phosphatidyl-inositol-anchored membrane family protein [candidate division BRC1 bacterium ADurb.BinA364]
MAPELAARYPEIKTYAGWDVDDPARTIRFDSTYQGFHAQVRGPGGAWHIDPYWLGESYAVYWKGDLAPDEEPFECLVAGETASRERAEPPSASVTQSGAALRTFRLAVACTGEYGAYHGGTVPLALSAIVTAINRVTGIYRIDLAIHLTLVANNDQLIYLNGATDPFNNTNASTLIGQSHTVITSTLGSANFDIGHTFSTGAGGLAGLGVVCDNTYKGRGVTGTSNPIGDPYYVDYVAHEIGHQFGANHTFNGATGSCSGANRNASTAYEPGSGSTIMAYAGICGVDNLQSNSDAFFHFASIAEIQSYVSAWGGCAASASTGNSAPSPSAGSDYYIPKGTPFQLTGSASDPNAGQSLTYCWEQRDLGPQSLLTASDNGTIPLFRSFAPTSSAARVFPRLDNLIANISTNDEKLPQLARDMDFRLTVRDNASAGGGVAYDDMVLHVQSGAGPFAITSPNGGESLSGSANVTWSVAGTDAAPISCSTVNILMSSDGGLTWPHTLAAGTPNDGSQTVALPGISTVKGRMLVAAVGNVFFDISDQNFRMNTSATGNLLQDPSFELGATASPWTHFSSVYVTPLYQEAAIARTGSWLIFFGGGMGGENGYVSQSPIIPQAAEMILSFYLAIAQDTNTGHVRVLVDGNKVFEATQANASAYSNYTKVSIDVSAYADGASHTIRFESAINAGGFTGFLIDDVALEGYSIDLDTGARGWQKYAVD